MRGVLSGLVALLSACSSRSAPADGGARPADAASFDAVAVVDAVVDAPDSTDAAAPLDAGAPECTPVALGAWSEAHLPGAIESAAVVATDTHAWLVGGFGASGATERVLVAPIGPDGVGAFVDSGRSLPGRREHHAAVIIPGALCAIGGDDGTAPRGETFCAPLSADGALGAFVASTPLPVARTSLYAAFVAGHVVAVGGSPDFGTPSPDVLVAPVDGGAIGAFRVSGTMAAGGAWTAGAALGDRIWVAPASGTGTSVMTARVTSDGTVTWAVAATAPAAALGRSVAVAGGRLWLLSGLASTAVSAATIAPDGTLGAFAASLPLPEPRGGAASLAAGPYLCALGGIVTPGTASDSIWCARACD